MVHTELISRQYSGKFVIVGSRSGGFNFYAQGKINKNPIWLGCSECSDLDLYADKNILPFIDKKIKVDRRNFFRFTSNINHGFEFPFFKDGNLQVPEDKTYLSLAIRKRMKLTLEERYKLMNEPFDIYDANKNYISTILFTIIPCPRGLSV
jgi:hypothetical protein